MKKLLALILCVMLFVSVIPTAAFAYDSTVGHRVNQNTQTYVDANGNKVKTENVDLTPKYQTTTNARRAVENLGKDINAMYTALAADQTVFGTAQSIYDMTDTLSKDLLKGIGSFKYFDANGIQHEVYEEDLATNVRKGLNLVIGNTITNYMNERVGLFTSKDATTGKQYVKPDKYIEVWGNAVKNALSSEKAQKNIEAMVTGLFALKVQKSVNDGADDLYTDIVDWDHWGEFNWGTLINPDTKDPDNYKVWNPVPDGDGHYSALISTGSRGLNYYGTSEDKKPQYYVDNGKTTDSIVVDSHGNVKYLVKDASGTESYKTADEMEKGDEYVTVTTYGVPAGNAALTFNFGTGFYLPNS